MPAEKSDILTKVRASGLSTSTECVVVGEGCLSSFNDILRQNKMCGVMVGLFDTNTVNAIGGVSPKLDQRIVLDANNLHADEKAVELVLSQLRRDAQVIVSFGSGTITDIARYCANSRNLTLICCPTAASVDGFCSSVCAMTFKGTKVTVAAVAPKVVIADLSVIANAPIRLSRSGLGDILGKYISLADWKIANIVTGEAYDQPTANVVKEALMSVTDLINNDGAFKTNFYKQITEALLLSGLAMQAVGSSRPASGAEHHFSHLISVAPAPLNIRSDALHGESVGVGTLALAQHYHRIVSQIKTSGLPIKKIDAAVNKLVANGNILKDVEFYRNNFGSLSDALYDENKNDCLALLSSKALSEKWEEVEKTIAFVPSFDELSALYRKVGLKSSLSEIGIDENKKQQIVKLSPYMRNRFTINRLLLLLE